MLFIERYRNDGLAPAIFFLVWIVAQLAVFWFEYFRILLFANIALFFIMFYFNFQKIRKVFSNIDIYLSFIIIYVVMIISALWSPDSSAAIEDAGRTVAAALPIFLAAEYLSRNYTLYTILKSSILIPIIVAPQIFYNFITYSDPALFGNLSMRTIIGSIIAIFGPMFFGMFIFYRKLLFGFAFLICFALILILQSRTGLLAIIIGTFMILVFYRARSALVASILIFPLFLLIATSSEIGILERFSGENTNLSAGEDVFAEFGVDATQRVDFDRRLHTAVATEMLVENPILGGGYSSILQNNKFDYYIDLPAHGYIGTFAEIGMLGFIAFVIFLLSVRRGFLVFHGSFRFLKQERPEDAILLCGFFLSLFFGIFHQLFESPYYALLAGLVVGRMGYSERQLTLQNLRPT